MFKRLYRGILCGVLYLFVFVFGKGLPHRLFGVFGGALYGV